MSNGHHPGNDPGNAGVDTVIPSHWHIFPVDLTKRPLTPNGHLDAKPMRDWPGNDNYPAWAVSCAASGLLVIDVDPRNGGDVTFAALEAEHGFPTTLAAFTGGGGYHLYYRKPAGSERFRKTLGPGIDVKCYGYVVLPPSPHASGGRYEWANYAPVAELPAWALAKVLVFAPNDQYARTGDAATCFLARAFDAAGWLGREIDDERVCVRCPWEAAHTTAGADSGTILFAPTETFPLGKFWCSHTSHGSKSPGEVLDALPTDALARAIQ